MRTRVIKKLSSIVLVVAMLISAIEPAIVAFANETSVTIDKGDYVFQYDITGQWDNHINASVTITNTGDKVIDNWSVKYNINGEIENIWNAVVYDKKDEEYIIKNATWNQDINVGESVSFGYTLYTENAKLPSDVQIICAESVVNSSEYEVSYNVNNSWGTGCVADIYINNLASDVIEDWILEFDYENEITSISGGVIVEHTDEHYVVKNPSYSQNIGVNSNVYIQILANLGNVEAKLTNVVLREVKTETIYAEENYGIELDKSKFTLDETTGYYFINEEFTEFSGAISTWEDAVSANIIITNAIGKTVFKRNIEVAENFIIGDAALLIGDNIITATVEYKNGTLCTEEIIVTNYLEDNMSSLDIDFSDIDGDGLDGFLEELYGTDPNNIDTDNDNISDYDELCILGYDPTKIDTNEDGIADSDEDVDGDGISNIEEIENGTDNCTIDSDGDTLTDYDELMIYFTNPSDKDTDKDGVDDDWEVVNHTNPYIADESFEIKEKINGDNTSVEIELNVDSEYADTFSVDIYENDALINSTIAGYLGDAYDFVVDGGFISATIKYEFDSEYLTMEDFNPVIYYLNEEEQFLEEIETSWDGESNYVTAELEHFSTYILLNKTEFDKVWEKDIKGALTGDQIFENINVVFVSDVSESMYEYKMQLAKNGMLSFIDCLSDNDRAGLVFFHETAMVFSRFNYSRERLKTFILDMPLNRFNTRIYNGINVAVDYLIKDTEVGYDVIILFTDGKDNPSVRFSSKYYDILNKAIKNDIIIHTVGLDCEDNTVLQNVAAYTGGKYFSISEEDEVADSVESIKEETLDYTYDSNNDGISDYYTRIICGGEFTFGTGSKVTIDMPEYREFQKNDDYDGDGLKNGEEIKVKQRNGHVYTLYYSDPTNSDTDGDGIDDGTEKSNGTDLLNHTIGAAEIDFLFNDDMYLSSVFSNEYEQDAGLRFQLYGGNILGNGKLCYVNDYKKALLEFMQTYTDSIYEERKLLKMKESYDEKCSKLIEAITLFGFSFNSVIDNVSDYTDIVNSINTYKDEIKLIRMKLYSITRMEELLEVDNLLITRTEILNEKFEQVLTNLNDETAKRLLANLQIDIDNEVYKWVVKFSEKTKSAIKKVEKVSNYISYGSIILEGAINLSETRELFSSIDVGFSQCCEIDMALEIIENNTNNDELCLAVKDVRSVLWSDVSVIVSEIDTALGDISEGIGESALTLALAKTGPLGWSAGMGLGLGELLFNTGELNEELLYVIVLGESASSYKNVKYELESVLTLPSEILYYEINDETRDCIEFISQLRIVGEDKYAKTTTSRGILTKLFDKLSGEDKESINAFCKDNIDKIMDLVTRIDLNVKCRYKDSYIYEER